MSRFCVPFMSHCSNGEVQFFLSLSFSIAQVCLYVFYNIVLSLTVLHHCSVPELASLLNSLLLTLLPLLPLSFGIVVGLPGFLHLEAIRQSMTLSATEVTLVLTSPG